MKVFHFRTKDMKKIINSPEWEKMHFDIAIKYCDYPNRNSSNRNCIKVKELDCKDCEVYQFGKHKIMQRYVIENET